MKFHHALNWLVPLVALLALATALSGLLTWQGDGPYAFTTLRGQEVTIDGRGLYRYDSLFSAAAFRGTDAATLLFALPLLLLAFRAARMGSLRGGLVLTGSLAYFLYNGASMAFSASFNSLYLVYTALFSASVFAFVLALRQVDLGQLAARVSPAAPRRGAAIFLFIAGIGTFLLWLSDLIGPLLAGGAPELMGPYTTLFTHGFDSALITPAAVLAGIYLRRRDPRGWLFGLPILILCALIGVVVIGQTIAQALAGIIFPPQVYVGMVGTWIVMGGFAVGLAARALRGIRSAGSAGW